MSGLTVFSVIRDGVRNGYPFVEAYGSWLDYADRVFVLDGMSTDGTDRVLARLARHDARFEFASHPWPTSRNGGSSIAEFTDEALRRVRPSSDRLMYVQADEIYTTQQRELVSKQNGVLEFAGCLNFWNSTERVLTNEFQLRYVRLFPATASPTSLGDGFTFDVEGTSVIESPELILHYGWCFPVNILQKHIAHARIYSDVRAYVMRGKLAQLMLERETYDRRLLDALAPHYHPTSFAGPHPECMEHLRAASVYDPYVGLESLEAGARW